MGLATCISQPHGQFVVFPFVSWVFLSESDDFKGETA
ncbi:hypothetical protein FRC0370_02027 [Corynebacterium diphtheriae]|nr:hypothetical protein FRC0370_02027 [Corynebacterium diphtheriae]CAB0970071.1 hypothetical protein FRC0463_02029 [Corynebacterium diphtheriae]